MFVALEITGMEPRGFFARLRNMLVQPRLWLEPAQCIGGRYAILKAQYAECLDWVSVEGLCGSYSGRFLFPEGVEPPIESRVKRLPMPRYENRILLKTACELIDRTRMPMYRRVLGFVDTDGAYTHMLGDLLKHYTSVKLYTQNKAAYEEAAAMMMEELGAPVILAEDFAAFSDCVLIVSPGAVFTDLAAGFSCPVLAQAPFVASGTYSLITALAAEPVMEVSGGCPAGIRPHDFAGALYECCGIESTNFLAKHMLLDYRAADIEQAIQAVARAAGTDL